MDAAEIAEKVRALEAALAAKASRISDLETRVSLLEAENTRFRKAVPNVQSMDHSGNQGPTFGRLDEGFGGNKQNSVGGHLVNGSAEVSDGGPERMAVGVAIRSSAEESLLAVPAPWKRTVPPVIGESGGEDEIEDADVGLEDDDVSIMPRGNKRKAMITSDSDDEDWNDKDGKVQEKLGVTPGGKRLLRGLSDDEDDAEDVRVVRPEHVPCVAETGIEDEDKDEDDGTYIREVLPKMKDKRGSRDYGELGEEYVESEDDSAEASSMEGFIDDEDCSENYNEEPVEPEESDGYVNYKDVMDALRRKRNANGKGWDYEAEMLSAFEEQAELCLKAVCALYRKQTEEEQSVKASMVHNGQGFNQMDAVRGSHIAEFLLDGDALGSPKKTVDDLEKYDKYALKFCQRIARRYSKQLFAIYQNKEDPYFP
ncbi:uncharacterized protein LOC119281129 [Triticum dicoccoides]|uniref:uncharacterized protein LOC119281129 n=1 Tax=Triticum dicoccoides TaxID=85692 RepID=UPI000E79475D|nr:uncharacterized protein LOC119281129 [Triticum dicoccoides]